jgi:hypothetical protein
VRKAVITVRERYTQSLPLRPFPLTYGTIRCRANGSSCSAKSILSDFSLKTYLLLLISTVIGRSLAEQD